MVEHLSDEGRHYSYFREVLTHYWAGLAEDDRRQAAALLPPILHRYFDDTQDAEFDRQILVLAGLASDIADGWLDEVRAKAAESTNRPRLHNSLEFLRLCGVLEHEAVQERLRTDGLPVQNFPTKPETS